MLLSSTGFAQNSGDGYFTFGTKRIPRYHEDCWFYETGMGEDRSMLEAVGMVLVD